MPVTMIVNDTDLIIDAALKGIGIRRILEPVVRQHIDSGRLIPILPDCWPTFAGLYLYFYIKMLSKHDVCVSLLIGC